MRQRLEALMRQPGFLPGLVAGIVVTALMGAVLWAINGDNEPPAAASKAPVPVSASEPEPSRRRRSVAPSTEDSPVGGLRCAHAVVASGEPATKLPSGKKVECPDATVEVSSAEQLTAALADAKPGDSIQLADGTYTGEFVATASGTPTDPIFLCGGSGAVLDGGSITGGYAFHLEGASALAAGRASRFATGRRA